MIMRGGRSSVYSAAFHVTTDEYGAAPHIGD